MGTRKSLDSRFRGNDGGGCFEFYNSLAGAWEREIVGEWIGSSRGLGYQMIIANAKLQPELLFSCLILLLLVVFVFFTGVSWLRNFIWRKYFCE